MSREVLAQHGLSVTNFGGKRGTDVIYPYPILRGFVTHPDGQDVKFVRVERLADSSCQDGRFEAEWPVCNRHFRGVVSLELGKNEFVMTTQIPKSNAEATLRVVLTYTPAQTPENFVLPVYIVCSDSCGTFQSEDGEDGSLPSAVRRIATGAGLLQSFTAEKLMDEGFSRKTFRLDLDRRGLPRCEVFRTRLKMAELYEYPNEALWKFLHKELKEAFHAIDGKCKFLAFLAATRYHIPQECEFPPVLYEDVLKFVKGHVALGGSSLALCSTGCLYTWPESVNELPRRLLDERPVDRRRFMDDSAYRGTRWACFSTTLGAAGHELGHTFDLGHTPMGMMARGFDDIYKVFTVARPKTVSVSIGLQSQNDDHCPSAKHLTTSAVDLLSVKAAAPQRDELVPPVYSTVRKGTEANLSTTMETEQVTSKAKEKTLAAKVSGSFHSKLFSSKKKEQKIADDITARKLSAVESPMPDDNFSTPSSCAISLFEHDGNHNGETCSISTVSTLPSTLSQNIKKSRAWHKRLTLGMKSPAESYSEDVEFVSTTKTAASTPAGDAVSTQPIITKHYNSYTVTTSSSDPHGLRTSFPIQPSPQPETNAIITEKNGHEKTHKKSWKKLFSRKKKEVLTSPPEHQLVEAEEQKRKINATSAGTTSPPLPNSPSPPAYEPAMTPHEMSKTEAKLVSAENVASKAGSDAVVSNDPLITTTKYAETRRYHPPGLLSVNRAMSTTSEEETFESPNSPDSLEEFSFKFDEEDEKPSQQKIIAVAVSQDIIAELHHFAPSAEVQLSPAVAPSAVVEQDQSNKKAAQTPEADYDGGKDVQLEPAQSKPRPTARGKRARDPAELVKPKRADKEAIREKKSDNKDPKEKNADLVDKNDAAFHRACLSEHQLQKIHQHEEIILPVGKDHENLPVCRDYEEEHLHHSKTPELVLVAIDEQERMDFEDAGDIKDKQKSSMKHTEKPVLSEKVPAGKRISSSVNHEQSRNQQTDRGTMNSEQKPGKFPTTGSHHETVNADPSNEKPNPDVVSERNTVKPSEKNKQVEMRRSRQTDVNMPIREQNTKMPEGSRIGSTTLLAPRTKSTEMLQKIDPSGKGSMLRFPLRTRVVRKESGENEQQSTTASRTKVNIPAKSTQASRNKENKPQKLSGQNAGERKVTETKKSATLNGQFRRRSFRRRSQGRSSGRRKKTVKAESGASGSSSGKSPAPSLQPSISPPPSKPRVLSSSKEPPSNRLDFKQINQLAHMHSYPTHQRSASRDSIGNSLASFLNTDPEKEDSTKDSDGQHDSLDENPTPPPTMPEMELRGRTLPRGKQNSSSLINTPSGISVMEDMQYVPHRLPLPAPPVVFHQPENDGISGGAIWTRNCAVLLNYHKWFNPETKNDPKMLPGLNGNTVTSVGGLRLVELRDLCGNVLCHWEFPQDLAPDTFEFVISKLSYKIADGSGKIIVVAVDEFGNLLHRTIRLTSS